MEKDRGESEGRVGREVREGGEETLQNSRVASVRVRFLIFLLWLVYFYLFWSVFFGYLLCPSSGAPPGAPALHAAGHPWCADGV